MATGNHQMSYGSQQQLVHPPQTPMNSYIMNQDATDYSREGDQFVMPNGHFAALGTPVQEEGKSFWDKTIMGKKLSFWCCYVVPPITLIMTGIMLGPVVAALANHSLHTAQFDIQSSNITNAGNKSFDLALRAHVTKTGIFPASLEFRAPMDVSWNDPQTKQDLHLGTFAMQKLSASGGSAKVNQLTSFRISDEAAFTRFAKYLVSEPSFVWHISCSSVHVKAFNFLPVYKALELQKDVKINGLDSLPKIKLIDVQLPGNDPAGGIQVVATATVVNPSPFGLEVGTLSLGLYYNDLFLGPVQATKLNLVGGKNLLILYGRILPYTNDKSALDQLGVLFTNYINSIPTILTARGISAVQADGNTISWLDEGIKSLNSSLSFVPPQPIEPIKSITINDLGLVFHQDDPYSPSIFSQKLQGSLSLPFGFSLNITDIATQMSMVYKGALVGSLTGAYSNTSTHIQVQNSGETSGILDLTLPSSPMVLANTTKEAKTELELFEKALVYESGAVTFMAQGSAKAVTDTPIGRIVLDGIKFNVMTGLMGLNGLNTYPTIINSVDVVGGTKEAISLAVDLSMVNPSNLNLSIGDVTFQLAVKGKVLGTATIQNMTILPGKNTYASTAEFDPNRAPEIGPKMLSDFIMGKDTKMDISGFPGTSSIPSLSASLEGIRLSSTLPALHKMLVTETVLEVPKDIAQTGIAFASVRFANPFNSSIDILKIDAAAQFQGLTVGTIHQDLVATNNTIHAPGRKTTLSNRIPININIEPKHLIQFIEAAAKQYKVDLGPLPSFFQQVLDMPDAKTSVTAVPDDSVPPCHSGRAFDTASAILALLKPLTASIPINSTMKLGEYVTSLSILQEPVPVKSDETALYLIGPAAAPLIQSIVQQSILKVTVANATNLVDDGFDVSMSGSLSTKTPADAYIEFPSGLKVNYKGVDIAFITMTPLCASPPDGIPDLKSKGRLTILNEKAFEDFTLDLLTQPNFKWLLHTKEAVVRTLGIVFSNVTLEKTIEFDGLDGLPGVTITDFTSPGDAPGLIKIAATTPIKSLSSLGVQLDYATFEMFFDGYSMGSIQSDRLFIAAKSTTIAQFEGIVKSQANNAEGLARVGVLFSRYLQGKPTILTIRGVEVKTQANQIKPVKWLSNALQRFSSNVTLPGKIEQTLFSISLSDLTVTIKDVEEAYSITASNNQTLSTFANPFGFHLQPLQVNPNITISYNGVDTASLALPQLNVQAGSSSGPKDIQQLQFGFRNQKLNAIDRPSFNHFFAALANSPSTDFTVTGITNVLAKTQIGNVAIDGVEFKLPTSMKGMNGFGGVAPVSNVVVDDPRPEYLGIHIMTQLNNPSNVTLYTDKLALPVYQASDMTYMGLAMIPTLNLLPGPNLVPALFQLFIHNNDTKVQNILSTYIQPKDFKTFGLANSIPLEIKGKMHSNPATTPYPSLEESMTDLTLKGDLVGLGARIVLNVRVYIPMGLLVQAISGMLNSTAAKDPLYAFGYIDAVNNIPSALHFVQLDSSVSNSQDPGQGEYSRFTRTFTEQEPFILPAAHSNGQPSVPFTTSPLISNILLTKGLIGSLPLIPNNVDTDNHVQAYLVGPNGQFFLPGLSYKENDVNTTYFITTRTSGDEGGFEIKKPVNGIKDLLGVLDPTALTSVLGSLTDLNPAHSDSIVNKLAGLGQGIAGMFGIGGPAQNSSSPVPLAHSSRRRRRKVLS